VAVAATGWTLVAIVLVAACGTSAAPAPTPAADPVAAVVCPLASAPTDSDADVAALARRADEAQQSVLSRSFDAKYRPLTSAAFGLQGAAFSLASITEQVPQEQRRALASSEPFNNYRQSLSKAQRDLAKVCDAF